MISKVKSRLLTAALAIVAAPAIAQPVPPLDFYGDLPAVEEGELSPSGAHTALLMTANGQRMVLVFDRTGAPIKQFTIGDAKVRGIEWVGDQAILLQRTETGRTGFRYGDNKTEWVRANILPLDDRRDVVSVFADQRYIANAVFGFHGIRNVGGSWKGYFGGMRMGKSSGEDSRILDRRPALFEVDLLTGSTELIAYPADADKFRDWIVGADGKVAATLEVDIETGRWKIDNASGKNVAEGTQPNARLNLIGTGFSGDTIVYSVFDENEGTTRRFAVSQTGGAPSELWKDQMVDHYVVENNTGRVLGIVTDDGEVALSDPAKQDRLAKALGTFPKVFTKVHDWTPDLSHFIVNTSGNYDSGSWYRVDATNGERMMLGLERPAIQGPVIGSIEKITYQAQDGLEIEGILTLPPGRQARNLPVIINPHGGPTSHDEPVFDYWAQAFASRGYAVLQPNFRGSTNKDEAFRAAGDGQWGRKMQTDLSDGLAALAERGIVDPSRACIVGASYGGYAALAGVTLQNGIYRCAVSVNGVADLEKMWARALSGRSNVFNRGIERTIGKDADLDALSPTKLAHRADAPVLLVHGRDDTVVPFEQSFIMHDKLKDAGKPVKFVELEGEDHWLSQSTTRRAMLKEVVAFVEKHNPAD
jgi:dipeptidyl aminopeptidase/acylaminoacyl peptidase